MGKKITGLVTVNRLSKEEIQQAAYYTQQEVRAVVDQYVTLTKMSTRAANQASAIKRYADVAPPTEEGLPLLVERVRADFKGYRDLLDPLMKVYAQNEKTGLGRWALSICGLGPTLVCGLLCYIDFHRCCCDKYRHLKGRDRIWHEEDNKREWRSDEHTVPEGGKWIWKGIPPSHKEKEGCPGLISVGAIYRYAGIDPTSKHWGPKERRPYNPKLKNICWQIGDQFARQSVSDERLSWGRKQILQHAEKKEKKSKDYVERFLNRSKSFLEDADKVYSRRYAEWKRTYVQRNEEGCFAEEAKRKLKRALSLGRDIPPKMKACWSSGRLQPAGLELMAKWKAVVLFLSHYYEVGYQLTFGKKTIPYPFRNGKPGTYSPHVHYIPPPNWPMEE